MKAKFIDRPQARLVVESGTIRGCSLQPVGTKWIIAISTQSAEFIIAKGRPPLVPRQFSSLDTAGQYVRDLGIGKVTVELDKWSPGQKQLAVG